MYNMLGRHLSSGTRRLALQCIVVPQRWQHVLQYTQKHDCWAWMQEAGSEQLDEEPAARVPSEQPVDADNGLSTDGKPSQDAAQEEAEAADPSASQQDTDLATADPPEEAEQPGAAERPISATSVVTAGSAGDQIQSVASDISDSTAPGDRVRRTTRPDSAQVAALIEGYFDDFAVRDTAEEVADLSGQGSLGKAAAGDAVCRLVCADCYVLPAFCARRLRPHCGACAARHPACRQ